MNLSTPAKPQQSSADAAAHQAGANSSPANPPAALRSPRSHLVLWSVTLVGLALDLLSKRVAFASLDPQQAFVVIPGLLSLQLTLNPGALFGIGSGMVPLFVVASVVALVFVLYLFAGTRREQWVIHTALALILAGALGNLYDRVSHRVDMVQFKDRDGYMLGEVVPQEAEDMLAIKAWGSDEVYLYARAELSAPPRQVGVVRDFLKITTQIAGRRIYPWVFNVADAYLVIGVGVLLVAFWRHAEPSSASTPKR